VPIRRSRKTRLVQVDLYRGRHGVHAKDVVVFASRMRVARIHLADQERNIRSNAGQHGWCDEKSARYSGLNKLGPPLRIRNMHTASHNTSTFDNAIARLSGRGTRVRSPVNEPAEKKLIKIGAKVVSDGRYVIFQVAEVAVRRQMLPGCSAAIWMGRERQSG
jgi:hypothetical protein